MLALLRRRDFGLLWFAGLISVAGDKILSIALPLHVYGLTGSALSTGLLAIAAYVPRALLGFIAGANVDRWDLKHTMVWAKLSQSILVSCGSFRVAQITSDAKVKVIP